MADDRERWALILGASSGMGEAAALALARAGYRIIGIHLDFRAGLHHVTEIRHAIKAAGSEAIFINMNAADDHKRAAAIDRVLERFEASRAAGTRPHLRVVMHSLAFGSLLPFLAEDPKGAISRKQMEMTLDVMANSLVFWVQDLWRAGLLERGSKVYAMTSEGSARTIPSYGAVSAAKAALESHCRQLAMELARLDSGVAVNAIRAGVTETPALRKIPEAARVIEHTLAPQPARPAHDRRGRRRDDRHARVDRLRLDQRQRHQRRRRGVPHRVGRPVPALRGFAGGPCRQASPASQAVRGRAAGVISRRPSSRIHQAASPRARARGPIPAAPSRKSAFDQTSAQAGSGPATVTESRPSPPGSPVRGSTRWWTARPSAAVQACTAIEEVQTAPPSHAR